MRTLLPLFIFLTIDNVISSESVTCNGHHWSLVLNDSVVSNEMMLRVEDGSTYADFSLASTQSIATYCSSEPLLGIDGLDYENLISSCDRLNICKQYFESDAFSNNCKKDEDAVKLIESLCHRLGFYTSEIPLLTTEMSLSSNNFCTTLTETTDWGIQPPSGQDDWEKRFSYLMCEHFNSKSSPTSCADSVASWGILPDPSVNKCYTLSLPRPVPSTAMWNFTCPDGTSVIGEGGQFVGQQSCGSCSAGAKQDPHLHLAHGGRADFRGVNNTHYALLSFPNLSFSGRTRDATFVMHDLFVNGSFFVDVAWTVVTRSNETYYVLFNAKREWCMYTCPKLTEAESQQRPDVLITSARGFRLGRGQNSKWKSPDGDLNVVMKQYKLVITVHGWEMSAIRKPVYGSRSGPTWRIDFNVKPIFNTERRKLFSAQNTWPCFPHGLIGQSFDGDALKTDGKVDDYDKKGSVTTEAMAEGAIEGSAKEYALSGPYDTVFKYSRFNKTKCAPRSLVGLNVGAGKDTDLASVFDQ